MTAGKSTRGADPRPDLAQRPLGIRPLGQLRARGVERLDQPDVVHRGGGVIGQRPDEPDLRRVERVRARREGAQRPEDRVAGRQRRGDHRADAEVLDDTVRVGGMVEGRVGEVVAGQDDGALGDGPAEDADPDRQVDRAHPGATASALDARVMGEPEMAGRRVHEVDHRAVGVEQPGCLGDRGDQQVVDLAATAIGVPAGAPTIAWLSGRGRGGRRGGTGGRRWRAAGAASWSGSSRSEDTAPSACGGIAVRRCRLRHPADAGAVAGQAAGLDRRPGHSRSLAQRDRHRARPTMRPDAGDPTGHQTPQRGPPSDVRHPHRPPPGRRRDPRGDRRPDPVDRLHPLDARRPAVHPQRCRLRRRRRSPWSSRSPSPSASAGSSASA